MLIVFLGKYNQSEILTGPQKVAKRLFHEFSGRSHNVQFIDYFYKQASIWKRMFGKENVDTTILRLGIFRMFFYLLFHQPDIIHIVSFERFILPLFLYKPFLKSNIVATIHGIVKYELKMGAPEDGKGGKFKDIILEYCMMNYSDRLVFVSSDQMQFARNYYSIDENKSSIIPNGVDEIFAAAGKKNKTGRLNIVMRKRALSDGDTVLENIKFIKPSQEREMTLFIIGDLPKAQETDLIQKQSYPLEVKFVSPLTTGELAQFLADKHLFLNTAQYETFSIMTAECMAAGLIPVVANTVGMQSFITNGENGFIYYHNNPESIGQIIEDIVRNKYDFEKISDNARKIYDELKWSTIAAMYEVVY